MKTPESECEREREKDTDSGKKMKIRGGGLHMTKEYDWWRNTEVGRRGGGGGDEAITLWRTG